MSRQPQGPAPPDTSPEELFEHVDSKMKRFLEEPTGKGKQRRAVSSRSSGRKTSRNSVSFSAVPEELQSAARNAIQMSLDSGKHKTLKEAEQAWLKDFSSIKLSGES